MNQDNIKLPLALAIVGFLFSSHIWIRFLDSLNPLVGLIVHYVILTVAILILEYLGLVIAGFELSTLSHTIGAILIIFSFFIVIDLDSCHVNLITKGSCKDISNIYLQKEDGAVYWLWSKVFTDPKVLRVLTYIISPAILSFIGSFLITEKVTILPF